MVLILEDENEVKKFLETIVTRGRVLVVGVGNELRCDDGFGVYIARALENILARYSKGDYLTVVDAGTSLESYLDLMINSEVTILLDVIEAPVPYSKVVVLQKHEIPVYGGSLSTHSIELGTLLDLVSGDVYVVGTRPTCLDFNVGVSNSIAGVIRVIIKAFLDVLIDHGYLSETLKSIRRLKSE